MCSFRVTLEASGLLSTTKHLVFLPHVVLLEGHAGSVGTTAHLVFYYTLCPYRVTPVASGPLGTLCFITRCLYMQIGALSSETGRWGQGFFTAFEQYGLLR